MEDLRRIPGQPLNKSAVSLGQVGDFEISQTDKFEHPGGRVIHELLESVRISSFWPGKILLRGFRLFIESSSDRSI